MSQHAVPFQTETETETEEEVDMTAFDPRTHQRDVGEKEHFPPQKDSRNDQSEALEARSREKAAKNNKDRHAQTGRALAAAREQAKRSGAT